ncbi:hypothetical protein DXG01_000560 [Tephrocybe rancida]|nr:hypothetical protein DXG01_000560 [Tephrocybe rancida]
MPGVLELGGKSMQIAFADPTLPADKVAQTLGAEFSRSEAIEKKLVAIAERQDSKTSIYNPCLPHHQPFDLDPRHSSIGSGDFPKCLAMAQSYLGGVDFGLLPLPALDIEPFTKRFYGVSSFWYTYKFFAQEGFYNVDDAYDPKLFRQAVDQYCNGSWLQPFGWDEGKIRNDEHAYKHCFAAAWMMSLLHGRKGFNLRLSDHETWKGLIRFPSTTDLGSRSSWTIGVATMIARNGDPKAFCGTGEQAMRPYPPVRPAAGAGAAYNETTILPITSGSQVRQPIVSSSRVLVAPPVLNTPVEPIHAPSAPAPVAPIGLFHDLPIGALNQAPTFSQGVACGALLLLLVFIGYRRFGARRAVLAPASIPDFDEKHAAVDVDAQPIMVRAHRALFDKAKGAIFLAGGENASIA